MKRNPSQKNARPSSPTNTTYSGISNYKTDSYRPLRDPVPPYATVDPRAIARTHFEELNRYLATYLAKVEPANSRSTARQKLTRLTRQQFQELSTDVYDELVRRKTNTFENEVPFLPVRDDFHPKRNQARQKLATLPTGRFKDLSSDVYYELSRRYPEFREEVADPASLTSPGSTYDDYPSPDFPANAPRSKSSTPAPSYLTRASEDRVLDSSGRPSEEFNANRRSEDIYGGVETYSPAPPPVKMMAVPPPQMIASRRKQSQDIFRPEDRRRPSQDTSGRRSEDVGERSYLNRRPSESVSTTSDSTSTATAQSATAGMGMVIPNKSTIAEEDIEVPYGREVRDSTGTAVDERERINRRDRSRERESDTDFDGDDALSPRSPPSALGGLGGLSGLAARLQAAEGDDDDGGTGGRSDDYFDKISFGRASVASDRSASGRMPAGRTSVNGGDHERMKRDYEYKIATMQSRITGLERDLENAHLRSQESAGSDERVRVMEAELGEFRRRTDEQANVILSMQKELDQLRNDRAREQDSAVRRARQDQEELQILRDRYERLEAERGGHQPEPDILDQLRTDMESLMSELTDLSRRNDELMSAKDSDHSIIKNLDTQLKDYKRKYEQAKTELRSVKATSQLYLQPPKVDDQLPVSSDGGLLDIHVTAFVSAIDGLLTAGRSSSPTKVLAPMKAVVNAVMSIVDDVRVYEQRPRRDRSEADAETLKSLRERAEATLSNLVTATKTHATSAGLSPVSLLDAAASHVATTVTDIGKIVGLRKASKNEQEQFMPTSVSSPSSGGWSPSLRQIDESRSIHQRNFSSTSSKRGDDFRFGSLPSSPPRSFNSRTSVDDRRRPPSHPSSSEGSATSPPPIFDKATPTHSAGVTSDDSAPAEGTEEAWNELKPYLEAQTESIVIAIQSVLSAVRSPTPPSSLSESLSQIITIVSSIVAVCKDGLPSTSAAQGEDILQELSDHANKLSEVQAMPEVTKESRQIMAKSSFAVANAMKALMKL